MNPNPVLIDILGKYRNVHQNLTKETEAVGILVEQIKKAKPEEKANAHKVIQEYANEKTNVDKISGQEKQLFLQDLIVISNSKDSMKIQPVSNTVQSFKAYIESSKIQKKVNGNMVPWKGGGWIAVVAPDIALRLFMLWVIRDMNAFHEELYELLYQDDGGGIAKTLRKHRYESLTVKELQDRCRKRKIPYSGLRKAELIAKLRMKRAAVPKVTPGERRAS